MFASSVNEKKYVFKSAEYDEAQTAGFGRCLIPLVTEFMNSFPFKSDPSFIYGTQSTMPQCVR